tara:strand:+ start:357 stop:485 length:129 start_codon:yes stop_codon:yes gene_type:complete
MVVRLSPIRAEVLVTRKEKQENPTKVVRVKVFVIFIFHWAIP